MRSDGGEHNMLDSLLSARPKIRIFRARDALFYFRLYDYGGDVLLTSQGADTEAECRENLEAARSLASHDKSFRRHLTKDSKFTYFLMGPAKKVLAVGAMYPTVRDCDDAIRTLKHALADSVVEGPAESGG